MKKIKFVSLLLLSLPAFASTENLSDTSSANLANLDYYAHPGRFLVDPAFSSSFHDLSGTDTVSTSNYSLAVNVGLPWDGLRIGVSDSTAMRAAAGGGVSYYYSGAGDPSFHLSDRLFDAVAGVWSGDVALTFSPSIGAAKLATDGYPGSNHKGFSTLDFTAALLGMLGTDEFRISMDVNHDFSGSVSSDAFPGSSYTREALWNAQFGLTDRLHLMPDFYVQAETDFLLGYSISYAYVSGASSTSSLPFHVTPRLELGYLPMPRLLLTASVAYNQYSPTLTNNGTGATTQSTNQAETWTLAARLEF